MNNVFGYVVLDTNSSDYYGNRFCNREDFKRELQGKPICKESILKAAKDAQICKFLDDANKLSVHSFFPDKGIAYLEIDGHVYLQVEWNVENDFQKELITRLAKIETLLKEILLKQS